MYSIYVYIYTYIYREREIIVYYIFIGYYICGGEGCCSPAGRQCAHTITIGLVEQHRNNIQTNETTRN